MTRTVPYDLLGGEPAVRRLAHAFYEAMDRLPEVSGIRKMHKQDLVPIEEKLFEYLSAWLGGPPIYREKYGHMCLTEAHAPYAIDQDSRDQWLMCMDQALDAVEASDEVRTMLKDPLFRVADMIRNAD